MDAALFGKLIKKFSSTIRLSGMRYAHALLLNSKYGFMNILCQIF